MVVYLLSQIALEPIVDLTIADLVLVAEAEGQVLCHVAFKDGDDLTSLIWDVDFNDHFDLVMLDA